MKSIFYIFLAISLLVIGYLVRMNTEKPEIITEEVIIKVPIENPINKTLLLKAKIFEDSLEIYKTMIVDIENFYENTPNINDTTIVVQTDTLYVDRENNLVAETNFSFDNYKSKITYFYRSKEFVFDYEKQWDEYKTIEPEKKFIRAGLYGTYFSDSSFAVGLVFNFPKIFNPLYLTIGADSDKNLAVGTQFIF